MRWKILASWYQIECLPEIVDDDKTLLAGDTDTDRRRIRLSTDPDAGDVESTLLHESIHAILHESGVGSMLDEKLEEAVCRALENGLHPLYRRRSRKKLV